MELGAHNTSLGSRTVSRRKRPACLAFISEINFKFILWKPYSFPTCALCRESWAMSNSIINTRARVRPPRLPLGNLFCCVVKFWGFLQLAILHDCLWGGCLLSGSRKLGSAIYGMGLNCSSPSRSLYKFPLHPRLKSRRLPWEAATRDAQMCILECHKMLTKFASSHKLQPECSLIALLNELLQQALKDPGEENSQSSMEWREKNVWPLLQLPVSDRRQELNLFFCYRPKSVWSTDLPWTLCVGMQ